MSYYFYQGSPGQPGFQGVPGPPGERVCSLSLTRFESLCNGYPTKKETHTVALSNFLENNYKFSYFIQIILKYVNPVVYPMNFTHLDSIHVLLIVKEQGRGHF